MEVVDSEGLPLLSQVLQESQVGERDNEFLGS